MSEVRRVMVRTFELNKNGGRYSSPIPPYSDAEFVSASDYDALRLQLSRAREWMEHKLTCPSGGDRPMSDDLCGCGLTEFLKEVGGDGK